MKLVTWLATDSEAIFGTIETPTDVNITAIGQTEDASGYCGLSFETTTPTQCTEITTVPTETYYFIYRPIEGYWLTDTLARFASKDLRQKELDSLTVTSDTHLFNADEVSQARMNRAYTVLGDAGTIEWTLADNTKATVTGLQLKTALGLAGVAQSALWSKYSL